MIGPRFIFSHYWLIFFEVNPVQEYPHILNILCILIVCEFLFCFLQTCPTGQFYLEFCGAPTPFKLFWVTKHFPRIDVYSYFFVKCRNAYVYSDFGCIFLKGWGVKCHTPEKGAILLGDDSKGVKEGSEFYIPRGEGGDRIPNTNSIIKNALYAPNPTQPPVDSRLL